MHLIVENFAQVFSPRRPIFAPHKNNKHTDCAPVTLYYSAQPPSKKQHERREMCKVLFQNGFPPASLADCCFHTASGRASFSISFRFSFVCVCGLAGAMSNKIPIYYQLCNFTENCQLNNWFRFQRPPFWIAHGSSWKSSEMSSFFARAFGEG